jgi:hypothetical protein
MSERTSSITAINCPSSMMVALGNMEEFRHHQNKTGKELRNLGLQWFSG